MAAVRKKSTRRDPRKRHGQLRAIMRKRVFDCYESCGICGHPVDKTLVKGLPLSPEIDEIIPVSRGGSPYDFENLQLAHRSCNRKKGSKMLGEGELSDEYLLPTSRAW
jgi:5-methylcytosine-specific restriction endonuclease McrA